MRLMINIISSAGFPPRRSGFRRNRSLIFRPEVLSLFSIYVINRKFTLIINALKRRTKESRKGFLRNVKEMLFSAGKTNGQQ
ncbi:hypothetical protein O5165_24830, partial [Escherichia coli]|nr:hypothetical protein [Escherichia coli]